MSPAWCRPKAQRTPALKKDTDTPDQVFGLHGPKSTSLVLGAVSGGQSISRRLLFLKRR